MHHSTSRAHSIGKISQSRSKSLTSLSLSDTGIEFTTSRLLLVYFAIWNPPLLNNVCRSCTRNIDDFTYFTDLRQKFTKKALKNSLNCLITEKSCPILSSFSKTEVGATRRRRGSKQMYNNVEFNNITKRIPIIPSEKT